MSLENLLKIGQLKSHPPDAGEIERLLTAADRNLCDARVTSISAETRFDAAYKGIMQSAPFCTVAWKKLTELSAKHCNHIITQRFPR